MIATANDNGTYVRVKLSRRNLYSLLAKLDGYPKDSEAIIFREGDFDLNEPAILVHAEEDENHYGDRVPGRLHPDTDRWVRQFYGMAHQLKLLEAACMDRKIFCACGALGYCEAGPQCGTGG